MILRNSHLHNEYDNGRVLRLLLKLNAVNERPEHHGSATWSETGDRYLLMLFRDYCFHQVCAVCYCYTYSCYCLQSYWVISLSMNFSVNVHFNEIYNGSLTSIMHVFICCSSQALSVLS
jgi:Pan3 Pseudokinase domain